MEKFQTLGSRTVVLPLDNVDTDQIIPARFLKVTTREGLGRGLFADWRYDEHGAPRPDFVLNQPGASGAAVLVAGDNFGCGSSREHAPWALLDHGFRAVVSSSIADIFRSNALKNGLLPVVVEPAAHRALLAAPGAEVTIDLAAGTISLPGGGVAGFAIDPFARHCLLEGLDELGFLLSCAPALAAYEAGRALPAPAVY
jgi:3-isopropylmalate/(R)-2-methylmalate dehydratase small subunit